MKQLCPFIHFNKKITFHQQGLFENAFQKGSY